MRRFNKPQDIQDHSVTSVTTLVCPLRNCGGCGDLSFIPLIPRLTLFFHSFHKDLLSLGQDLKSEDGNSEP